MIQLTMPQTLAYGLNDFPVGLAAWIIEKFYGWSDTKGHIENGFSKHQLLTYVIIYWVRQTINASIQRYFEESKGAFTTGLASQSRVKVPTGAALFQTDAQYPLGWAEGMPTLANSTKCNGVVILHH